MHRHHLLTAALFCVTAVACGRGNPDSTLPLDRTEGDSVAVSTSPERFGPAQTLVGSWELRRIPPRQTPGLSIIVTIDSAREARYFGRLTHYFSGNVGQDPQGFGAFEDSILPDGSVAFFMPRMDSGFLGIVMEGRHTPDTIGLERFVLGPDTISSGTHRWILVKNR